MLVGLCIATGEMIVCVCRGGDPVEVTDSGSNISQKVMMAVSPAFIYLFILTHVLVHRQHPLSQDVYSNAYKIDRFRDWDLFTPSLT